MATTTTTTTTTNNNNNNNFICESMYFSIPVNWRHSPSVPSFVFAVLFIPSFNVLSSYFYISLSLVAVPTV